MEKLTALVEAFEANNDKLSTKKFSEEVYNSHQDVAIALNPSKVLDAYETLSNVVSEYSNFNQFINKGIEQINERVIDRNLDYFLLKAANAYRLQEIYDYYEIDAPEWLPKTWRTESHNGVHQYTFLFDWSTVDPRSIAPKYYGYFIMKLNNEISAAAPSTTIGSALSAVVRTQLSEANFPESRENTRPVLSLNKTESTESNVKSNIPQKGVDVSAASSSAKRDEHSMFVCRKYLSLDRSASKRGLDFTLSVADLEAMLRNPTCHFTGEPLVHFFHNPEDVEKGLVELPSNYLTIDRLDSDKGYVKGNVVLCGKAINEMKDRMSNDEFEKALNMRRLVATMGLTPEQIAIMTS